jgi:hypothetical protein
MKTKSVLVIGKKRSSILENGAKPTPLTFLQR